MMQEEKGSQLTRPPARRGAGQQLPRNAPVHGGSQTPQSRRRHHQAPVQRVVAEQNCSTAVQATTAGGRTPAEVVATPAVAAMAAAPVAFAILDVLLGYYLFGGLTHVLEVDSGVLDKPRCRCLRVRAPGRVVRAPGHNCMLLRHRLISIFSQLIITTESSSPGFQCSCVKMTGLVRFAIIARVPTVVAEGVVGETA